MKKLIAHLVWDDQGQDLIEYVLIGSVVSIGALVGAQALGTAPQRLVRQARLLGVTCRDQRPASLTIGLGGAPRHIA